MSQPPKILAFSGSTRAGSLNQMMVRVAAEGAREAGAEVTELELRDLSLPLFDEDVLAKEGLPQGARSLKEVMKSHQGLLIASPEFNSSITPMLKNAIDWASIRADGEQRLACFQGKVAGIMSTSPGAIGGLRGLVHLRSILSNIQVIVLPDQKALPNAHSAFGEGGKIVEEKERSAVKRIGSRLVEVLGKLQ